ncbi:MAG: DUF4384 domain-containing protein [Deltaproteobacteria bacterium]|nr:MAG: DUF4384 domain-containing protein [Deltaproteobacteria bacterium]
MWGTVTMKTLDCLSEWHLDQLYYSGEQWHGSDQAHKHIESCDSCRARFQSRTHDAETLQQQAGFQALLKQGTQRLAAQPTSAPSLWSTWLSWQRLTWASAMAAALVVVTLFPRDPGPDRVGKSHTPTIRMLHFRKGSQYSQWTRDGERLRPGALIQFTYQLSIPQSMMIVSLNQAGKVSVFFPLGKRQSVLRQAGTGTLPPNQSLELDDSIGKERIFVIASTKPFSLSAVQEALLQAFKQKGGDLAACTQLSKPWNIYSILIHKQKEASHSIP